MSNAIYTGAKKGFLIGFWVSVAIHLLRLFLGQISLNWVIFLTVFTWLLIYGPVCAVALAIVFATRYSLRDKKPPLRFDYDGQFDSVPGDEVLLEEQVFADSSTILEPELTENTNNATSKKRFGWGALGLSLAGVAVLGSCLAFPRQPALPSVAPGTPTLTASAHSILDSEQWLVIENDSARISYPPTWEVTVNQPANVVFAADDAVVSLTWYDEEGTTDVFFDTEGNPIEMPPDIKASVEAEAHAYAEQIGNSIVATRYFVRSMVGKFPVVSETAYEVKAAGGKPNSKTDAVYTFLPYVICGEYRVCRFAYVKRGDEPMTEADWAIAEQLFNSIEFTDIDIDQLSVNSTPVAESQVFANEHLTITFPANWQVSRNDEIGIMAGDNETLFVLQWQSTNYDAGLLLDVDDARVQPMRIEMEQEISKSLSARGVDIISVDFIEKSTMGAFPIVASAAFISIVEAKETPGLTSSFLIVPSVVCGGQRLCHMTFGITGGDSPSDNDWIEFEQIVSSVKFADEDVTGAD